MADLRLTKLVLATVLPLLCAVAPSNAQVTPKTVPAPLPRVANAEPRPGGRLAPNESIPPAELEAFIDGLVRAGMDQAHVAGVAVSVVQDGRVVLKKGYGFASFAPVARVDPDATLFRIGSITKTFTWIAVMKAVEAGKMDIDAPVNMYLTADLQIPPEGFSQQIRMRDLMTHSPGFEDHVLGVLFANDPARVRSLQTFLRSERPRRVREPGGLTSYSNYGVALAGAAVSNVEGVSWQDLIEMEILNPLGLSHTSVREPYPPRKDLPAPMPEALARDLSNGFRWAGESHKARDFEYITPVAPAGGISASAGDLARYMLMLLGGGSLDGVRVFGPHAAEAFRTPMTTLPREVGAIDAGFFEWQLPGGFRGYGHNGGTLSFFTDMTLVPELRLGIFVATNTEGGGRISDPLPARVVERFYGPARKAPAAGSVDVAEATRIYAGTYLATRRSYSGLEGFALRFQTAMPVTVSPDGYLVAGGGRYIPAGSPDLFQAAEGEGALQFERDGKRASRIMMSSVAFERVGTIYQTGTLMFAAVLALIAAGATLAGAFLRIGRSLPATGAQRLAGRVHLAVAVLWLITAVCVALFAERADDIANIFYSWPGPLILTASSAALAASVLTLGTILLLPAVWRPNLQHEGWSSWRKLRFSFVVLVFAVFAALLAAWGALQPWAA